MELPQIEPKISKKYDFAHFRHIINGHSTSFNFFFIRKITQLNHHSRVTLRGPIQMKRRDKNKTKKREKEETKS